MTIVSQAFVSVRPDLTDFNAELKAKLTSALKVNVADRTIFIRAQFEKGTREALLAQLPKGALPVLVKPVLVDGAAAELRREIGIVPVEVALVGGAQAKKTAAEIAAIAAPASGGRATIAGDTEAQAQRAATRAAARKAASDAAAAVAGSPDADLAVLRATQGLVGATASLEAAAAALTNANKALTESEVELAAATTQGSRNRIALAELTNQQAIATQRQAALDAEGAAAAKTSADAQAIAADRLTRVKTAVALASEKAAAAEITNANALELQTQASSAASLAQSEFSKAQAAGDAQTAARILALKVEALQIKELIAAQLGLTEISGLAAAVPTAGRTGGTELAKATLELSAAKKADTLATEVLATAQASANRETIEAASAASLQTRNLLEQREATVALLRAEEARAPALARIASINTSVARANDPTLSLAQRATAASNAHTAAAKAVEQFAAVESGATKADRERIVSLEATTLALKEQTVAQNQASIAAAKAADSLKASAASAATFRSQAERGAAATGATFLGLRGAVLSASTGFLLATVAVTGLSKIVQTAEELQQSLNIFRSVAKATADQMLEVDQEARTLGADLTLPATSALDAADAMTELAKAGLSVDESMNAAKGVLQLAAAANLDVGDSANIVATELNAFALAGDQATRVANLLAGASVAAQGDIGDFALAFQQTSAVAHQVGLSLETTTAVLTQFAKAGLHGSDAGTSLRTLLLRLVPTTKAAADAQEQLGIKIDRNIPIGEQFTKLVEQYTTALAKLGPVAQQEVLTKIFGQDAIRGAAITFTQGSALLNDIQKAVSAPGQVQELAAARTEGLGGAVEGLKSEVSTLAATLGSQALPLLSSTAKAIGTIAQNANDVVTAVNKLSKITVTPLGNLFGGVDTVAQAGIAIAVGLGARSLLQGRAQKAVEDQLSKAVLSVNQALEKRSITQDEVNALWEIMGINAEEATVIQVRALQDQEKAADSLLKKQQQLAIIQKEGAALVAGAPTAKLKAQIEATEKAAIAEGGVEAATAAATAATARAAAAATAAGVSAVKAADIEIGAANGVTEALQRQTVIQQQIIGNNGRIGASALLAEEKQTAGFLAGLKTKAAALTATQAGVTAGIGLSVAGGAIGGQAGGLLSAAGSGAVLGSFLPIPGGTIIGAAAFGGLTLLKDSIEADRKRAAAVKDQWASMTFAQQQTFLLTHFPNQAAPGAAASVLADAIAKSASANKLPDFTPVRQTAQPAGETNAAALAEANLRDLLQQTAAPGRAVFGGRVLRRPRVQTAADFAAEQGGFNIPSAALNIFRQNSDTELAGLARASESVQRTAQGRKDLAAAIKRADLETLFAPGESLKAAGFSVTDEAGLPDITVKTALTAEQIDALDVATAKLSGSTENLKVALEKQEKDQLATIAFLRRRLTKVLTGQLKLSNVDIQKLNTELLTAISNADSTKDAIDALTKSNQAFSLPTNITIAGITAGSTKTLLDDLAAKQAALAAITTALKEHANKTQEDKDAINALRIQQAQANSDVLATSAQIDQQNVSNTQSLLQDAADTAGNLGQAENKYIEFLRGQVTKSGNTTAEVIAARRALNAELDKRKAALAAVAQATTDITNARLANQLARAEATPGAGDNKVALQAQINFNNSLIAGLKAEEVGLDKTTLKYKQKELAIQNLIGANIGLAASIKGLNNQNGFSLQDLFKESLSQFNEFASNVSSSPNDLGQVRGKFAATLIGTIANRPKDLKELGLTDVAKNTSDTNALLRELIRLLEGGDPRKTPSVINDDVGPFSPIITTNQARRLNKVSRGAI